MAALPGGTRKLNGIEVSTHGGHWLVHSVTMQFRAFWRLPSPPVWLVLTIVGLVALGLRLAFLFRAPVFIIGDSENYFWPGYQLAREIGFDLDIRRTPVYPLFITLVVTRIGEDLAALALAQHLLGVATSLLIAGLGMRFWGRWTGLLAGLLVGSAAIYFVALWAAGLKLRQFVTR